MNESHETRITRFIYSAAFAFIGPEIAMTQPINVEYLQNPYLLRKKFSEKLIAFSFFSKRTVQAMQLPHSMQNQN